LTPKEELKRNRKNAAVALKKSFDLTQLKSELATQMDLAVNDNENEEFEGAENMKKKKNNKKQQQQAKGRTKRSKKNIL
jgi:hypothetical protein